MSFARNMSFTRKLFVTPSAAELFLQAAEHAAGIDTFHHVGDLEGFTVTYEHPSHGRLAVVFNEESDGSSSIGFEVSFSGPDDLKAKIQAEGWINAADACLNYLADVLPDVSLRFDSFSVIAEGGSSIWLGTRQEEDEALSQKATQPTPDTKGETTVEEATQGARKVYKRAIRRVIGWSLAGVTANGLIGGVTQGAIKKYGDTPAKVLGIAVLGISGIVGATYLSCSKILGTDFQDASL